MSYFLDRDKACETSAITTVNLKTNDQKFGSHIGNMSNPLYLEIDSWVRTTTVSIMFGEKNFAHLLYSMFKTHTCIYILSSLKPAINGRNLSMTSFMTLFTSCTCTCNTLQPVNILPILYYLTCLFQNKYRDKFLIFVHDLRATADSPLIFDTLFSDYNVEVGANEVNEGWRAKTLQSSYISHRNAFR